MASLRERLTRIKGRATQPVANAAGDRHSEAKAEVEAHTGHKPSETELHAAEHETRLEHGDIQDGEG